jgi:hypothetical protein
MSVLRSTCVKRKTIPPGIQKTRKEEWLQGCAPTKESRMSLNKRGMFWEMPSDFIIVKYHGVHLYKPRQYSLAHPGWGGRKVSGWVEGVGEWEWQPIAPRAMVNKTAWGWIKLRRKLCHQETWWTGDAGSCYGHARAPSSTGHFCNK